MQVGRSSKNVKKVIEKSGSSLALGPCSVQVTRFDKMDHLDLIIAKQSRRIEYTLCTISGKAFGKESALTVLVPKKPVALSGGIIDVDQRVVESAIVNNKNKNNISTYKHIIIMKTSAFVTKLYTLGQSARPKTPLGTFSPSRGI